MLEVIQTKNSLAKIQKITIEFHHELNDVNFQFIGVDPGTVNYGLTVLDVPTAKYIVYQASIYQIKFNERKKNPLDRVHSLYSVLEEIEISKYPKSVIIEGASYGDKYRQAELAEIRMGTALWFDAKGSVCHVVSPNSIRSHVFGSAKIKAHEYWKELEKYPDAAASLSCALCPV